MYIEVGLGALEIGKALYEHRGPLTNAIAKIINYVRLGKVRMIVFGLGGTGKTTLGELLKGDLKAGAEAKKYDLSLRTEEVSIKGKFVASLIIPGGQERRIINDWPALFQQLAAGESKGIINVVSYGHHSFT